MASASMKRLPAACVFRLLLLRLFLVLSGAAPAAELTRADIVKRFPAPFSVGSRDAELPLWPIFRREGTADELVAYVFESADYAAVPGFAGVPVNLLIALDPKGRFLDVKVVSQHEPVFLDGLGEAPMFKFVAQYKGLSLHDNILIDTARHAGDGHSVHIDGVAKATASVRIINQTVLSAALKVARKKLGFSGADDTDLVARVKPNLFEPVSPSQLLGAGLTRRVTISNAQVEKAFAGTDAAGLDARATTHPQEPFADLYIAWVSVPSVGRNLLTQSGWRRLQGRLEAGDHAILVMAKGRYNVVGDGFVPGSVPDRLVLRQSGLTIEMRDLNLDLPLADGAPRADHAYALRVIGLAGLDPSQPLQFSLQVTRLKGMIYPQRFTREFRFDYTLPDRFYVAPQSDGKSWQGIWKQRRAEIAVMVVAVLILFVSLARQKTLTGSGARLAWFRTGYLLFTLFFIGWYAQGQLSIVNITGVLQALKEGRSLAFLLYDPITVVLWCAALISLFIWGRGTFCGWLCPFGALQELAATLGRLLRVPTLRVKSALDARLKLVKYLLLALIVSGTFTSRRLADGMVEIEPFKTAITLIFMRSWPFVAYALVLVVGSAFVYKFFCRYLCPFGAGLAILGRVRLFSWIARRSECGKPCQTCRHRCNYEAIRPDGAIRYDECFQCMDCVAIHQSDEKCAPLIYEKKRGKAIPISVVQ